MTLADITTMDDCLNKCLTEAEACTQNYLKILTGCQKDDEIEENEVKDFTTLDILEFKDDKKEENLNFFEDLYLHLGLSKELESKEVEELKFKEDEDVI